MRLFFRILPLALALAPAFASDEVNIARGATMAGPGLAARGYDVVSFFSGKPVLGSETFSMAYEGASYRFASKADLDAFQADPAKYAPAFGGFCAYGVAVGHKFDGDPTLWKVVEGKLYFNLNEQIQAKWSEDIPGNLKKADESWKKIRSTPVDKL